MTATALFDPTPVARSGQAPHAVVSISRLSAMTGVTPRALRHYEAAGLIRPHRTTTGVRLFTADQCERASLIVRLRRCDLSLEEIRDVLTDTSADRGRLRLRQMLQQRAAELNRALTVVRETLAQTACVPPPLQSGS